MIDVTRVLRTERSLKPAARWAGDKMVHLLYYLVRAIPERSLHTWGTALGHLFYALSRRHRHLALRNLRLVYPSMPESARRRLARKVFVNFGKSGMEFLRLPFMQEEELSRRVRLEGTEHLDAALACGKGVIMVSAHFGNWELVAGKLLLEGYRVDAITRNAKQASTTTIMTDIRQSKGMRVIPRGAMLAAVRSLKENRILAILSDQNDYQGIVLDFLGHPAMTSVGSATLALMTGAVLVPIFGVRQDDGTICGKILAPILPDALGDRQQDIRNLTERITRVIEAQIRALPDQWLWFHGRWKPIKRPAPPTHDDDHTTAELVTIASGHE